MWTTDERRKERLETRWSTGAELKKWTAERHGSGRFKVVSTVGGPLDAEHVRGKDDSWDCLMAGYGRSI